MLVRSIRSLGEKRAVFFFLAFILMMGCRKAEKWHTTTFLFFDTVCEVKISCTSKAFAHAKEAAQRQLEEVENQFSPGEKKGSSALAVELYQQAQKIYHDSSGFFDLTIGPLSSLWGFHEKKYRIPSPEEISAALKRIGMHQIHVDQSGLIIPPEIELDWGGIAKGLGIEAHTPCVAPHVGFPGLRFVQLLAVHVMVCVTRSASNPFVNR